MLKRYLQQRKQKRENLRELAQILAKLRAEASNARRCGNLEKRLRKAEQRLNAHAIVIAKWKLDQDRAAGE